MHKTLAELLVPSLHALSWPCWTEANLSNITTLGAGLIVKNQFQGPDQTECFLQVAKREAHRAAFFVEAHN